MAEVSAQTGLQCTTFAWPNGNYDLELAEYAVRCGASSLMTTNPTWVERNCSLWHLPRVQLFGVSSRTHIESKIALAAFRGILSNPNGSGRAFGLRPREHTAMTARAAFLRPR